MKLNEEAIRQLLESRGWSEVTFARLLHLDYSYVYRVLRGERGIGKKFITGLLLLCEKEGLNFRGFVEVQ
jgi:transcriptional regulator with XRE-family HTH domain